MSDDFEELDSLPIPVARALRAASDAIRIYPLDLERVIARGRRKRRAGRGVATATGTALLTIATVGFTLVDRADQSSGDNVTVAASPADSSWISLRNAKVRLDGGSFQLKDGRSLKASRNEAVVLLPRHAIGRLGADQAEGAVGIAVHTTAGSGEFYYLVADRMVRGKPASSAGLFLGDRIQPVSITIHKGAVRVTFQSRTSATSYTSPYDQQSVVTVRLIQGDLRVVSWDDNPVRP